MALSSINIQPAKSNSESHNERKTDLDYVFKEKSSLNQSWKEDSIAERREFIEYRCKELTGRKLQKNATPIREGVLLFESRHTMKDMHKVKDALHEKFGIKTFQIHMHRDEGRYNEQGTWKPNLHAHFVFDWSDDNTGKMLRLGRADLREVQSVVAETLRMERGKSSDLKHLSAIQYKIEQEKIRRQESNLRKARATEIAKEAIVSKLGMVNREKTIEKFASVISEYQRRLGTDKDILYKDSQLDEMENEKIKLADKLDKTQEQLRNSEEWLFLADIERIKQYREKYPEKLKQVNDRYLKKRESKKQRALDKQRRNQWKKGLSNNKGKNTGMSR